MCPARGVARGAAVQRAEAGQVGVSEGGTEMSRPASTVRYEEDPEHPACSVLGLAQCPCPYASSVCDGELHCHRAGDCLAVTRWAARVFQEIQARTRVMVTSLFAMIHPRTTSTASAGRTP